MEILTTVVYVGGALVALYILHQIGKIGSDLIFARGLDTSSEISESAVITTIFGIIFVVLLGLSVIIGIMIGVVWIGYFLVCIIAGMCCSPRAAERYRLMDSKKETKP